MKITLEHKDVISRYLDDVVSVDGKIMRGRPCISGTRIPVHKVLELIDLDEAQEIWNLTPTELLKIEILIDSLSRLFSKRYA